MPVKEETVEIARGLVMPFLPMRPHEGNPLRSKAEINRAVAQLGNDAVLVQPVPTGIRACLALVDRNVFLQDKNGRWIARPPSNGYDFLKLPNHTCLDGFIAHDTFYSSECLAVRGQSLIFQPAAERETVAYQLTKLLKHQWLFRKPSAKFIRDAKRNLPEFQGLVFKDYLSFYSLLSAKLASKPSENWTSRSW